uniref:Uncharacterized protein n=1 Tax=viral metagenome TaxID=1070528 RepID=A0A6M3KPQ6_9ZZZZ
MNRLKGIADKTYVYEEPQPSFMPPKPLNPEEEARRRREQAGIPELPVITLEEEARKRREQAGIPEPITEAYEKLRKGWQNPFGGGTPIRVPTVEDIINHTDRLGLPYDIKNMREIARSGMASGEGGTEGKERFIRLSTKAENTSQAAKNKAFNNFPVVEGSQVVYKPYGEQGKGFYYVPEGGRTGIQPSTLSKGDEQPKMEGSLETEARKYKSAEEWVNFMRGSATQYRDYNPKLRSTIGLSEESQRISELGVDPELEVTIYRGVSEGNKKLSNAKIVDGDFVTTDFQSAASYSGKDNVIQKKVKAKDLIADYASEFDKDKPFGLGAEFVYSDSKNKLVNYTQQQLTDIWNKANK